MPYNTRRKSVSLSLLGIHVPNSSRSSSHRSPPASTTPPGEEQPPSKKLKRSHTAGSRPGSPTTPSQPVVPKFKDERPTGRVAETTPPPSPGETGGFKIDTEGINDEIVVGVIEQLEKTGNRPHLLKELAAVLSNHIPIVESSANQPAIISSRLSTYMKRQWTALAPCPLGKELIGTHPKRIYFFLTTQPRQPFPEPSETVTAASRIISPSLTSAENEEEDEQILRAREEMSPSPEIDLSSPELEDNDAPMSGSDSFSNILSHTSTHDSSRTSLTHGRASPPLEGDEREFTQTASSLQQRRKSESLEIKVEDLPESKPETTDEPMTEADESEESAARRNKEAADVLFGEADRHLLAPRVSFMESSPMLKPQIDLEITLPLSKHAEMHDVRLGEDFVDSTFMCETVELDELDDLFQSY